MDDRRRKSRWARSQFQKSSQPRSSGTSVDLGGRTTGVCKQPPDARRPLHRPIAAICLVCTSRKSDSDAGCCMHPVYAPEMGAT